MMIATQAASFAGDATRQLLTLATGVLAVTVTFMSDLVPSPTTTTSTLMALSWLSLLVGIVAGVVCLFALASEVARAEKEGGAAARASIRRKPVLIAGQARRRLPRRAGPDLGRRHTQPGVTCLRTSAANGAVTATNGQGEPMTTPSQDGGASLRTAYDQLCVTYRAIDDFRAKLLGFLPLVTGGGLVLLTGKGDGFARELFLPVGIFGVAVTLGLFSYEIYGIKKCHALITAGIALESSLGLKAGQFKDRPREVLGHVNEPFAAAIIYPAVMAAWAYLAGFNTARWAGVALSVVVFVVGFAVTFEYNRRLGRDAQQRAGVYPTRPQPNVPARSEPRV